MSYDGLARGARGAHIHNAIAPRNSLVQIGVLRAPECCQSRSRHRHAKRSAAAELGQAGGSVPWSGSRSPPNALAQHGRTDGRGRMLSARERVRSINLPPRFQHKHTHTHSQAVGRAGGRRRGTGPRLNDILAL